MGLRADLILFGIMFGWLAFTLVLLAMSWVWAKASGLLTARRTARIAAAETSPAATSARRVRAATADIAESAAT